MYEDEPETVVAPFGEKNNQRQDYNSSEAEVENESSIP